MLETSYCFPKLVIQIIHVTPKAANLFQAMHSAGHDCRTHEVLWVKFCPARSTQEVGVAAEFKFDGEMTFTTLAESSKPQR